MGGGDQNVPARRIYYICAGGAEILPPPHPPLPRTTYSPAPAAVSSPLRPPPLNLIAKPPLPLNTTDCYFTPPHTLPRARY